MPITSSGIVPSFIVSSASILKRETYGQLIEPIYNKWLIRERKYISDIGLDKAIPNINDKLHTIDNEIIYTYSGSQMVNPILCGPMLFMS